MTHFDTVPSSLEELAANQTLIGVGLAFSPAASFRLEATAVEVIQ